MTNRNTFCKLATLTGLLFLGQTLASSQTIQSFVSITPCRAVDTRNATGLLGGPRLAAAQVRSFPLQYSGCNIPVNASAYSLNVTVVPPANLSFLSLWAGGAPQPLVSTLNDPNGFVLANAAIVPAGLSGGNPINVFASDATDVIIDINGYFAPLTTNNNGNTSLGNNALSTTAGGQNTAIGFSALAVNSSGSYNSAIGSSALIANTSGFYNTAMGNTALAGNASGNYNTALGAGSQASATASDNNTSLGYNSMNAGNPGSNNTIIGAQAGQFMTGANNIALGFQAATNLTSGGSNIDIGNAGAGSDSSVIRIGTTGNHTQAFIAGIFGVNVSGGSNVVINSAGQLGVVASSRRYKEDIHAMGDASDALMQLEPVAFRYRQAAPDGNKELQYGLIAEQVATVFPELVVRGAGGEVESVQYQQLPALLLNEVQKQHRVIEDLQGRIAALEQALKNRP